MITRFLTCLLIFVGINFNSSAQITTCQLSLTDSTKDILYLGIANRICIKNLPENCKVVFEGKTLEPDKNSTSDLSFYELNVVDKNDVTLHVNNAGKEIYKKTFTLKYLTNPRLQLGIVKETSATVAEILAAPFLHFSPIGEFLKPSYNFNIHDYVIIIIRNHNLNRYRMNARNLKERFSGVQFEQKITDEIRTLKNGDEIMFEDIHAYGPDGVTRAIPNLSIHIISNH